MKGRTVMNRTSGSGHLRKAGPVHLMRIWKNSADMFALLSGFTVMMAGCMLTVKSMLGGLLVFAFGFLLFWL